MGNLFKHKKTGNLYVSLMCGDIFKVINATNAQDGQEMVMYRNLFPNNDLNIYVREKNEFLEKFEPVEKNDLEPIPENYRGPRL